MSLNREDFFIFESSSVFGFPRVSPSFSTTADNFKCPVWCATDEDEPCGGMIIRFTLTIIDDYGAVVVLTALWLILTHFNTHSLSEVRSSEELKGLISARNTGYTHGVTLAPP